MISPWLVPKMWAGGECFILGGGASVLKAFSIPEKLANAVQQGDLPLSVLSPFFAPIHNKHVIGINCAYMLGDWIDILFFGDGAWYETNKYKLAKSQMLKVSCCATPKNDFNKVEVKWLARDREKYEGITTKPGHVIWNAHSGGAAMSLAYALGVTTIYLLGFDMCADVHGRKHWHGEYRAHKPSTASRREEKKVPVAPFNRHLRSFPQLAQDAKRLDLKIINLNMESRVEEFTKEVPPWLI